MEVVFTDKIIVFYSLTESAIPNINSLKSCNSWIPEGKLIGAINCSLLIIGANYAHFESVLGKFT